MKKLLATILALVMAVALCTVGWAETSTTCQGGEGCTHQAAVETTHYDTLIAAVNAVSDNGTVTLLRDCAGAGVGTYENPDVSKGQIQAKSFTIDFAGHVYTIGDPAAGSTTYETQGFHLEWSGDANNNHTVIFKDGAIVADKNTSQVKMLVQNYCNLRLENMVLDGENLVASNVGYYTLSNCCGTVSIVDTTIYAHEGGVAFDVDGGRSQYDSSPVVLTVSGNSAIIGKFEVTAGKNNGLNVTGGIFTEDMNSAANRQYVAADAAVARAENMSVIGADNIVAVAQEGIDVEVLVGDVAFSNVPSGTSITNAGGGNVTVNGGDRLGEGTTYTVPSAPKYYYKNPSTTTEDTTKGSPKTFDAGVGIYAVTAVLSVTGMARTAKKRH